MARVGPAAGAPRTEGALSAAPLAWLVRNLEAEQERWFLWLPVMFGAGIALYFLLPVEPWTAAALLPVVAALAVHWTVARGAIAALMTGALLATALGIAAGKLRTEAVRAPVLQKLVGPVDVYGFVELVEPRPTKGQRLTVRVTALEKHEQHEWPARVRVRTLTEAAELKPGDAVRLKAMLSPPPGPALPGDFDFARAAWFQGLGAVGYATAAPEPVTSAVEQPLTLRVSAAVARLRQAIGRRIVEALPGQAGAIANALITGQRTWATHEAIFYFNSKLLVNPDEVVEWQFYNGFYKLSFCDRSHLRMAAAANFLWFTCRL